MFLKRKIGKKINKIIWQKPTYSKREIVNDEILDDGKCILRRRPCRRVASAP